jgi:hypothetical protein
MTMRIGVPLAFTCLVGGGCQADHESEWRELLDADWRGARGVIETVDTDGGFLNAPLDRIEMGPRSPGSAVYDGWHELFVDSHRHGWQMLTGPVEADILDGERVVLEGLNAQGFMSCVGTSDIDVTSDWGSRTAVWEKFSSQGTDEVDGIRITINEGEEPSTFVEMVLKSPLTR